MYFCIISLLHMWPREAFIGDSSLRPPFNGLNKKHLFFGFYREVNAFLFEMISLEQFGS